jgi:YggT family protein
LLQTFASILILIINVLTILVFVYVISSWIVAPDHPIRTALGQIVEPLLLPIRNLLPQTGMIDFSGMVLLILLQLLHQMLARTFL